MSLPQHDPRTPDESLNAARIDTYVTWRRASGIRPATLKGIRIHLRKVAALGSLDTITADELAAWMASHGEWAPETRRAVRVVLRGYFEWATTVAQVRRDNPTTHIRAVRVPPSCPRPVPEDALTAALRMADREAGLMIMLGAHAGLRVGEIAGLHTDDLHGDLLRVTGKGGKTRVIPIGGELLMRLRGLPAGWVFPGRFEGTHCTPDTVNRRVQAFLPRGYTVHKLRHRYATTIYGHTGDLLTLQRLLGHSNPETTRRYVGTSEEDLRRVAAVAW